MRIQFAVSYDRETAEIRAKNKKKISRIIGKLFPDRRLIRQPIRILRSNRGDVFTTMMELEDINYFWSFMDEKMLKEKLKIAIETALYMLHYRVETYVATFPQSCRVRRINECVGYWFNLELSDLREIREEVIAMHSEGFPP